MRRLKAWANGFDDTLTTFRGRIIPRQSDHLRYNRTREYWVLPAGSWEVMMIKAKLKRPKKPRPRLRLRGGSGSGSGGRRPQLFIKRKRKYVPDKKWFERVAEDQRRDMVKPVAERVQRAHLYHVLDNNVRSDTTPCVELGQTFFPWARLPPDIQDAIIAFAWGKPDELRLEWLGGDERRFQARRLHHGDSLDANIRPSRRHAHRQPRSIIPAPPPIPLPTLLSVNRAFATRVLRTIYSLTSLHFTSAADLFRFLETIHATYLPLLGRLVLSTTDLDAFEALTPRHAVASRGLRSMMLNSGADEGMGHEDCCGSGERHGHGHGHHRAPHRGKSLQRVDEDEEGPRRGDGHRHGGGGGGHSRHRRKSRAISSSDSDSSSSVDEDCCCGHDIGHDSHDHHDNHATDTSSSFFFAESESSPHKRRGRGRQKKRQTAHNHSGAAAAAKGHAHHGSGHQHGGGGCCGDDNGYGHGDDHAVVHHSGFSTDDDDAPTEETQWWRRRGCQLPAWLRRWWSNKKNKTLPLNRFWIKGKKVFPRLHSGKRKKNSGVDKHKQDHSHHNDKRQQTTEQEEEDERRRELQVGSATQPRDVLTGLKSFVLRIEGGEEGGGRRHFKWMWVEDDERGGCRPGNSSDARRGTAGYGGRVVCVVRGEYASETGLRAVWGADWLVRALRETMAPRMCEVRIEGLLPDGEAVVDEGARGLVVAGGSQQRGSKKGKERAVEAAVPLREEGRMSGLSVFDRGTHEEFSGDEDWQSAVSTLNLAKPVQRSTVFQKTKKQTDTYLEKQGGGAQGIPWRDLMLPNDYKRKFRLELL